ncbi:MAG: nicotinate-nucleotide adenylyltransferase [Lachnospiraceae bacterium]|nr:nicotinate-nucleotide adenylyltransferase [Lachnospiraceae bacterium]
MSKECKVGILGGTFNPIHIGHLILAEQAYEEFDLEHVIFLPSGVSYLKKNTGVLPAETRYEMVSLAVSDNDHFSVSKREIMRKGNTYTSDTITELNRDYPGTHFFFILGADTLFQMENWFEPAQIFGGCTILASVRNGRSTDELKAKIQEYEKAYNADIRLLKTTDIDISSKMIRSFAERNHSIRYYVPDSVNEYILEKGLYRGEAPEYKVTESEN